MKLGDIYNPNAHHRKKDSKAEVRAKRGTEDSPGSSNPPPREDTAGTAGMGQQDRRTAGGRASCTRSGKSQSSPRRPGTLSGSTLTPQSGVGAALWPAGLGHHLCPGMSEGCRFAHKPKPGLQEFPPAWSPGRARLRVQSPRQLDRKARPRETRIRGAQEPCKGTTRRDSEARTAGKDFRRHTLADHMLP